MPRRRRRRGKKNNICLFLFFFSIFFLKNNLAKFWKFWEFLEFFFYNGFHWKRAFSAALMGWKIFEKKNGFQIWKFFTFFMPKATFFRFLDHPYFRAGCPKKKFGISLNFLHRKIFRFGPPPFRWTCKFPHFWNVTLPLGIGAESQNPRIRKSV